MAYLTKTTEVYRVANEREAEAEIEKAKKDNRFELAKYTAVKKNRKEKKEIVDEWIQLTLVKKFCDETEPDCSVTVDYTKEEGFFPQSNLIDADEDEDLDDEN